MSLDLDLQLLLETNRVATDIHHAVGRLLDQGACANVFERKPNDFRSALGNLVLRGYSRAVREMLEHGACVHWPEREINQVSLAGSDNKAYQGFPVDCLTLCMEMLGSSLSEGVALEIDDDLELLPERMDILGMVLRAGANPAWPDPATARLPSETFLYSFDLTSIDWRNSTTQVPTAATLGVAQTVESVLAVYPDAPVLFDAIARGDWSVLPDGWSELADYPAATAALRARCQAKMMERDTAAARPAVRAGTARL